MVTTTHMDKLNRNHITLTMIFVMANTACLIQIAYQAIANLILVPIHPTTTTMTTRSLPAQMICPRGSSS